MEVRYTLLLAICNGTVHIHMYGFHVYALHIFYNTQYAKMLHVYHLRARLEQHPSNKANTCFLFRVMLLERILTVSLVRLPVHYRKHTYTHAPGTISNIYP